ncbi:MAG: hypothetical protein P4L36_18645 [Holophaga sp.]|nr:hypothetical protein [Holophaga sp.]
MRVMDPKLKQRRRVVRCVLLVVYAGLIWLVFSLGKGHTLILDNKDAEDGSVKAAESLSVSVDGQEPIDLGAGDRDMAKVQGQGHRVEITVKDGPKVVRRIRVPVSQETLLVSLPKLLAGAPAVSPFMPLDAAPPADEQQGNGNAFTSPSAPESFQRRFDP